MSDATGVRLRVEEREGDVLAIVLDRPDSKVNLIDEEWLAEMTAAVDRAERERPRGLVLLSAKPGNFIAGADVSLIASLESEEEARSKAELGQRLLDRIDDLPFLTVAAIGGSCLGGGLETVLACDVRVCADDPSVVLGLPEVKLGILPGFGGTWRLPRTIGVTAALPLVLAGSNVRPRKAIRLGLVDRLTAPERLERVAVETAGAGKPPQRRRRPFGARATDWALGRTGPGRNWLADRARKDVAKKTGGHYPAAAEIIDRVIEGGARSRPRALVEEAAAFGRLAVTPVSKNLLFLFRGNEDLGRHPWTGRPSPVDRDSKRAVVVGAGTMGGGIAGALATRGVDVRLKDVATESLRLGLANAAAPLNRRVKKRAMKPRERDAVLARIAPSTDGGGLARADLVIEAVPEILELKIEVFRDLEERVPETAMLATNTSSIPIERIAGGLASPERLVGLHFFNPVDRMPLVEIIPGARTRPAIVSRAVGLVRRLKKSPIVVADRPGFLVNRVLLPYLNEAALCVDEGWAVERIDGALLRFGMPMGPLRVLDEVGLDVAAKVSGVMEGAFGERARPAPVLARLLEAGALGAKTGRGFWTVRGKDRAPNVGDLGPAAGRSGADAAPDDGEIVTRLLLGMVNEAARCLAEGVVTEPEHLDLGTVLGTGFPPFRGGVRRWALTLGEERVRTDLGRLAERHGARFVPADCLGELFRSDAG
jgi:3-hydroxyacyl-CoA dehydrogenase/enoyl-CoA hydratase/3-hydroxybutyryl-CoA epimerase